MATASKLVGPTTWDIRGRQNNWNWKLNEDAEEIDYQTRFPALNLAAIHKGTDISAPILATIKTDPDKSWSATITLTDGREIVMANTAEGTFATQWIVKVQGREVSWEYEHPAMGDNCMYLVDRETGEVLGNANDNYLSLHREFSEVMAEELVITGTAAQIMLAPLMHNDMTIAVDGPEGREEWRYQVPGWEDEEVAEDAEDEGGRQSNCKD